MAIAKIDIWPIGPDSSHLPDEKTEMLGKILACLIYNEVDKAAKILLELDYNTLENLEKAADKLSSLCFVVRED